MDSATTHGGSPYVDVHKLCVCGLESKKKKKENEIPGLMASIIFIHRCTDIFGNGLGRRVIITLSICSQNLTLYASYWLSLSFDSNFFFRTKFEFAWIQWLAWFSLTLCILMYHVLRDMLWLASSKRLACSPGLLPIGWKSFFAVVSLSFHPVVPLGPALSNCWRTQHIHTHTSCVYVHPSRHRCALYSDCWCSVCQSGCLRASNSAAGNPPRSLCSFVFVSLPPENLPAVQENGKKNSLAFIFCKLLPIFEGKSVWMPRIHCLEEEKKV